MLNQAYQKDHYLDLFFVFFFICDLFFDEIDIDLANYADGRIPYVYDLENEKKIDLIEKNIDKFFDWFSDNF